MHREGIISDSLGLFDYISTYYIFKILNPEVNDFYLDSHQSLADQRFAKSLDRSTGMLTFFLEPFLIKISAHLLGKIAQLR